MSDEDFDFAYSSEEEEEEDVDIERQNHYYEGKGKFSSGDLESAMQEFESVFELEEEPEEWGFKSLKQIIKILLKQGNTSSMIESYKKLLQYANNDAVTRSKSEKTVNSLLDHFNSSFSDNLSPILKELYEITLSSLKNSNPRLWFKTDLKLAYLYFQNQEYSLAFSHIQELRDSCIDPATGEYSQTKGTQVLEIYALEIQLYTVQKDIKKLESIYKKALHIKSAVPHPKILGIIRECGGKMHMMWNEWKLAYEDFFESFKAYDEAGMDRRVVILNYLLLANMLMGSNVNPFDAQEVRPYKSDPQVVAMTSLLEAYSRSDIDTFEKILNGKNSTMEDSFIQEHTIQLLNGLRIKILLDLVKPYNTISLDFLGSKLGITSSHVEDLLVLLILNKSINGSIDQLMRVLVLKNQPVSTSSFNPINIWSVSLNKTFPSLKSSLQ